MTFELTAEGVQVQTVSEILAEMETSARAAIHDQLDCSETSPFGQLFGVLAEREMLVQQQARAIAQSFSPRASGQALAAVSLLTGTVKRGATKSQVSATVNLNAGVTLPALSRANVNGDTTAVFETIADVTNGAGITANVAVTMRAVNAGPVRAASGALTVINTPVSGWNTATNAFDATVGLDIETDPQLRVRRIEELRVQGSTVVLAIAADVAEVAGVTEVAPFENTGTVTDADGLTAHSFEIVVWDGVSPVASSTEIAQMILNGSPAGIAAVHGTAGTLVTSSALDREGATQAVVFTRAGQKTLYVSYTLTVDGSYPVDGDVQVKAAAATALTAMLGIGDDVIRTRLFAAAYSITGVTDVTALTLGFTAAPVGTSNLVVGSREIAVADTSRIVVAS